MSHFYGTLKGQAGAATRRGSKLSGINVVAASWAGAIETQLYVDKDGNDCYRVVQIPWHGQGVYKVIAEGKVGQ